MTDRNTASELARLSEGDVVRRELDKGNRRTLGVLLVTFAAIGIASLIIEALYGPVPGGAMQVVLANVAVNIVAAAALRRVRGSLTPWVLAFCVIQFLLVLVLPMWWAFSGIFALLFCRFRLTTAQTAGLFGFITAVVTIMSRLQPMISPSAHITDVQTTRIVFLTNLFFIICAAVLQIAGTRRVRGEILDEWREPLQSAREELRMRDELHYARQMQLAMLPEAPPVLDWLELAAVSIPAAEVGGDYYDFFVDQNRVAVVACDVAGHGMQSGLVLAAMRGGLITTLGRSMSHPAAVLDQLHDLVAHTSRRRMLAAAVVVLFDREEKRVTIASAGHPPVMLRRGAAVEIIEAFAPPLGVRLPFTSGARVLDLEPGDVLVIHSDGVYESRNAAGEEYGLERLQQFIAVQPADATANDLRDAIVRDVERFRGRAQDDDVTVVVARVMPHGTIGAAWI